jgi:DNA (cytosine-5)-methyltransferase 1
LTAPITFGSVCSGIEAASVAWHRFGWRAAWLAEIEGYPAKLLHHHYGSGRPHHMPDPAAPDLDQEVRGARAAAIKALAHLPLVPANSTTTPPNLGDMTRIEAMVRAGQVAAPDVLCGGTPCQGFSLAGLRGSLDDARGQLTLSFVRLADAIDAARSVQRKPAAIIVWENVHGVLSTKDNAFGNFLGALAGEDSPLEPPRTGWTNAGCVFGPRRAVAWRVYDAQYFGVAQRRRRVFVVASAREGFDPAAVLLEFDGVRRDSPPSRGAQENTAGTVTSSLGRRRGQPDCGSTPGFLQPVVGTLDASYGRLQGCAGQDASHGHSHLVPVAFGGNDTRGPIEVATACRAHAGPHLDFESETFLVEPAIGFNAQQDPDSWTERAGPLACTTTQAQAVTYAIQAGALRTNPASGPDGVGVQADIAYTIEARAEVQAVCVTGDVTHTLKAEGFDASEDGTGRGQPIMATAGALCAHTYSGGAGGRPGMAAQGYFQPIGMAVRRLTPRECERLQGFPDDHTLVPVKKISQKCADKLRGLGEPVAMIDGQPWQLAADGPRYKALGNSWAVTNVIWIGNRIDRALRAQILENAA